MINKNRRLVILVSSALFLAACGVQDTGESGQTQASVNPRDVTSWSPSFVPSSDPITSADASKSRLDQVAEVLKAYDLPVPTSEDSLPEVVRIVSSYDAPTFWAQCLTEQGFETSDAGGFVTAHNVVPEQEDIYHQTFADCVAQYPINAKFFQTWGSDQWKVQYEYLVDYYIPCVESYGISIDPDSIPTEQVFVESGLSQGDVWHPIHDWAANPDYAQYASTETPEGAELNSTCRQAAPEDKLFG